MADRMKGYVAIHREIWTHIAFKKAPMSEREAFIFLISQAAYSDTQHRVGSVMVDVKRGSFLTTLEELRHNMLWSSDKKVRGFLKLAQSLDMIRTKVVGQGTQKKTEITICNYEKFQGSGRTEGRTTDELRTDRGRTGDVVKKKGNKGKKEEPTVPPKNKPDADAPQFTLFGDQDRKQEVDLFEEFWEAYPHRGGVKRGKKEAKQKWDAARKRKIPQKTMVDGALAFRQDRKAIEGFAPDPSRWITRELWNDEIEPMMKGQDNGNGTINGQAFNGGGMARDEKAREIADRAARITASIEAERGNRGDA